MRTSPTLVSPDLDGIAAGRALTDVAEVGANHGPVVAGSSLDAAVGAIEELEATARLFLLLHGHSIRPLDAAQVQELRELYPS